MELRAFLTDLVSSLRLLDFVASVDIQTEAFRVKGRVYLKQRGFLEIYFNEKTQTVAIAWIEDEIRKWGIDHDSMRGWHRHPLGNPEDHQTVPTMTIRDIINELAAVWGQTT